MLARSGSSPSSHLWSTDRTHKALLDAVPVAMAVLDGSGRIAHCNSAWRELASRTSPYGHLGSLVTTDDAEGTPYLRRLAALEGPLAMAAHRLSRAAHDALEGRRTDARIEYRMRRPDGEQPFEAIISPLPSDVGPLALVQHVDTGDRDHALDAQGAALRLGLALEDQRALERRLRHRMSDLGRELHNPITPVRLELHLLLTGALGELNEKQRRALGIVERNVQRWADGEHAFQQSPADAWGPARDADLAALASAAAESRITQALQLGVTLVRPHGQASLPVHVPADLVADVIDRFLGHALSTSPSGSTVAVEAREHDGEAIIEVRDSGPSRSPREVRSMFEPWKGRPPSQDHLDLALHHASQCVQAAGGRVWAESDGHGQGLLLALAFPLRTEELGAPQAIREAEHG